MKKVKSAVLYCLMWQAMILLPVFFGLMCVNLIFAYSFLLGAAIFIVSNLYFIAYASRFAGFQQLSWIMRAFNRGQAGKFVLSALGFALVFHFFKPIVASAVFGGFVTMILLQQFISCRLVSAKRHYH